MPYDASGNRIWLSSQDTLDILQVQELEPVTFIDFNNPVNQGDYLIISHAGLRMTELVKTGYKLMLTIERVCRRIFPAADCGYSTADRSVCLWY